MRMQYQAMISTTIEYTRGKGEILCRFQDNEAATKEVTATIYIGIKFEVG